MFCRRHCRWNYSLLTLLARHTVDNLMIKLIVYWDKLKEECKVVTAYGVLLVTLSAMISLQFCVWTLRRAGCVVWVDPHWKHWRSSPFHPVRYQISVHWCTVLTRNYAPFDCRPPLLFAEICCGGIFISNLSPLDHKLSSLPFWTCRCLSAH